MIDPDEPVFVVDLTPEELDRTAAEIRRGGDAPRPGRILPEPPDRPIEWLALVTGAEEDPLLLPLEPTRDVVLLDALARLIRIAVLSGERIPAVAINYGDRLERILAFERRLPRWAYEGIDPADAAALPREIRAVLVRSPSA